MALLTGVRKKAVTVLLLLIICLEITAQPEAEPEFYDDSTNENKATALAKQGLKGLKELEESTLKGWYEMVKKFLHTIKPNNETLFLIIDYIRGTEQFEVPESLLQVAKMNTAFLSLVCIGIVYSIVMLLGGFFFLYCRICGRCGAKESQKQTSSLNCWKTTHKFCLMIMIAFLVVPITCMFIINQHMSQSLPSVKNNATAVFTILSSYANDTQKEVDDFVEKNNISSEDQVVKSLEVQFASSVNEIIDNHRIDDINSIVKWLINLQEQYTEVSNTTSLSNAVHQLKTEINQNRELYATANCTSPKDVCDLASAQLSIEKIDVEEGMVLIEKEFEKLVGFANLQNVIEKIQNRTILTDIITERSDDLINLARRLETGEKEFLNKMRDVINSKLGKLRNTSDQYHKDVKDAVSNIEKYEDYSSWTMIGICLVLLIPVVFLVLGLICGCCGYQKQRHPTKRSSLSNCGGGCLILSVYCFFLIASVLMLLTVVLFVFGGNFEAFICAPLYDDNFEFLDQVMEKYGNSSDQSSIFMNTPPSKILTDCRANLPLLKVLNITNYASADADNLQMVVGKRLEESDLDSKLRTTVLEKTTEIRMYLDNFTAALNLTEMKDLPQRVLNASQASMDYIKTFSEIIATAIQEGESEESKNDLRNLQVYVNHLSNEIVNLDAKLRIFSSALQNISSDADNYKVKIKDILNDLEDFEQRLPQIAKKHLLQFVMAYADDVREKFISTIGNCSAIWLSFDIARTVVCQFTINPVNGYWFGLGWSLLFAIPTIIFAVKLSRHYLRMKYDDDVFSHDSTEVLPLEDLNRSKPFSYTNSGAVSWVPHFGQPHNYVVHPASSEHVRQFNYK